MDFERRGKNPTTAKRRVGMGGWRSIEGVLKITRPLTLAPDPIRTTQSTERRTNVEDMECQGPGARH